MFVVAGVTGNTGKVVADSILDAGKQVRVIVRDANKAEHWFNRGAQVSAGELQNVGFLTEALRGAEGAYLLLPPNFGTGDTSKYQRTTGEALLQAIQASGVPHVAFLSSIGADQNGGTGVVDELGHFERKVSGLSTKFTFLRAAYFMENLGSAVGTAVGHGAIYSFLPTNFYLPMIATKDIGIFATKALLNPPAATRALQIAGPEDYSYGEAAKIASSVLGRPVQVVEVPKEGQVGALIGAGLPADAAALMVGLNDGITNGRVAFNNRQKVLRGTVSLSQVFGGMLAAAKG